MGRLSVCMLIAVSGSGLTACGTVADTYRANDESRRVYPVTGTTAESGTVDLIALLDPLGVGANRMKVAAVDRSAHPPPAQSNSGKSEVVLTPEEQ